ncbi:hypothetical protein [Phaeospirillum tilakii]|uniref:Uncharacterized protein n=1 Tax=Phaeospirillum tilakii TaxID=741673 RepID=A0ABW5C6M3_9PROT
MPQYRLTADAFVGGHRRRKGEVIEWSGPVGTAMQPIDPPEPVPPSAKAGGKGKATPDQDA